MLEDIEYFSDLKNIFIFDTIDSTNDYAKTLSETPAVIAANSQTKGRGRRGREFFSPKDSGIYFSILLENQFRDFFITPLAAVAVCNAIRNLTGLDARIKWVNDIYLNGKKICGILTETKADKLIIGFGINFYGDENILPDEIKNKAGFLFSEKPNLSRGHIIAEIYNELAEILKNDILQTMEDYKNLSFILGKKIRFHASNKIYEAQVFDIDCTGAIILKFDNDIRRFIDGEISLIL